MRHHPPSRRCAVAGCRAWAKRGETLCSAHLRAAVNHEIHALFAPLLGAVEEQIELASGALGGDTVGQLDAEIVALQRARAAFLRWAAPPTSADAGAMDAGATDAGAPALPSGKVGPAQFLRVWNDSSSRLLRLLEARHRLGAGGANTLVEVAYRLVEEEDRRLAAEAGMAYP